MCRWLDNIVLDDSVDLNRLRSQLDEWDQVIHNANGFHLIEKILKLFTHGILRESDTANMLFISLR